MVLLALLMMVFFAALVAAPLTFFAMLFLGNIGIHIGFIELLPGAMALRMLTASFSVKEN